MLPSEKSERRIKRLGVIILLIFALIFLIWMIGLIAHALRGSLQQRAEPPEEGRLSASLRVA